jgi:hypothetical protein
MSKALRESHHFYHATAYGLAGELVRPHRHSIPTQAATMLVPGGGRGFQRVENFRLDGVVSFDAASVEVGGSYDPDHHTHTTYAQSVIENLNIADIVKADKVVARLAIYSPRTDDTSDENRFDITGSHFENLRIVGHKLDVKLATHRLHDYETYRALEDGYQQKSADDILCLSKLSKQDLKTLQKEYSALNGLSDAADAWKQKTSKKRERGNAGYWCSAANHLENHFGKGKNVEETELKVFGNFILIPKFGVVRLAEMVIHKNMRTLNMVHVQMCSAGNGNIHTGGTTGNGLPPPTTGSSSFLGSVS